MIESFFQNIFNNTQMPVIVCEQAEDLPVVFANASARQLVNPLLSKDALSEKPKRESLREHLPFVVPGRYDSLVATLEAVGGVEHFQGRIRNHEGSLIPVSVTANQTEVDGRGYMILYVLEVADDQLSEQEINSALTTVFQIANQTDDASEAINSILAYTGSLVQVSRTYIFEEITNEITRNTYEWCAPGIEPAIQDLQSLRKEDYNYDFIMSSRMYVTDDIDDLPEGDREILAAQGIKALAILAMFHAGRPIGYVGYDDCVARRNWSRGEITLLKNVANILVSLIVRRDSDQRLRRSHGIMQAITDNIENVIYVNDVETYELVFLNKTLADSIGVDAELLIGQHCWASLQKGMEGPCPFCPMPKMIEGGYRESGGIYTWEFQNTITGKWYLLKDSIVKWIDGRDVHIETATEITSQKEYELQLKRYASTDMMTGALNREGGYQALQEMKARADREGTEASLVFIDIDGLKSVNDTYGHDVGDEMILGIVDAIRASARRSDLLSRWGGDEFILALECGTEVAGRVIGDIEKRLEAMNAAQDKPFQYGFSHGVALLNGKDVSTVDEAINHADQLMYETKMRKRVERDG